jgi:type VI secretion system secreted protein VgrG
MPFTQDFRSASVTSPLGKDVLLFFRMQGREEFSRAFELEVDLLSDNRNIAVKDVLGKKLTVALELSNGGKRYFNGYAVQFSQESDLGEFAHYRAILRPWLWFLTRKTNCRIFQDKTVPEIVKTIFEEHGFSGDVQESLSETYRQREYCVQYRESDFDFVNRLLEEEGIYYFFKHESDKHILNLVDSANAHSAVSGYAEVPFFPPENPERRYRDHIFAWSFKRAIQPGTYTVNDFDFEKPKASLIEKTNRPMEGDYGKYEQYDYPGGYVENADGSHYSKVRLEALQADYERFSGEGNVAGLEAGALFKLIDHPRQDQNQEYVVTGMEFRLQSNRYKSVSDVAGDFVERIGISAIAKTQQFRTAHCTPRPVVRGPQTAIVVGKAGEEIWTDQYGRVKVKFHWDRAENRDETSSCWVRVSQPWAGKGWGAIAIPRIGQEVIVDFLEGNPDQPIITGRVYNSEQTVPYALPGKATQTGIKSRSTKGCGQDNFNEIRMEDKYGNEEIYVHAEKDMNVVVENSATLKVGFDKKNPGDQTIDIYNHRTTTLEQGNDKLQLKKGNREVVLDMGNHTLSIKQGNQETKIDLGKSTLEAMQSIELKVGQNSIKIDQSGITIKGMMVNIEGTTMAEVKSPMTTVKGDGMLTAKGGLVMIN